MDINRKNIINEDLERIFLYKFITKYVFMWLIFAGCIVSVCGAESASAAVQSDYDKLKTKVIKAYKEYKTELDIGAFEFYINDDKSSIKDIMTEVVNKTPSLFYTNHSYSLEYNTLNGKIVNIQLGYASEYKNSSGNVNESAIKKASNKINKEIKKITSQIKSGMNSVDKALFVHDYIVKNTSYENKSSNNSRLTEYGVLVKHKGNCQGYSLAYAAVMEKLGFSVGFVNSDSMEHVWNLVKIGAKWYNIDVTWDDPVDSIRGKNQDGVVYHKYFLASDSYMKKNGHYGYEKTAAQNTNYDKSYVKSVTSAFDYSGGNWVYMNSSGIYRRRHVNSDMAKCLYKVQGKCFIKYNSIKYYYISHNRLYIFSCKSNKSALVWSPVKKYGYSYYIVQLKCASGKIKYSVLNAKNNKVKSGSLEIKKGGFV